MPERQQWAAAAHMLEMHGNDVGIVLLSYIRKLVLAGDVVNAQTWLEISEKAQRLFVSEGFA